MYTVRNDEILMFKVGDFHHKKIESYNCSPVRYLNPFFIIIFYYFDLEASFTAPSNQTREQRSEIPLQRRLQL